jgi:uncharacterized membrane protein YbhN (UPF0104 family)
MRNSLSWFAKLIFTAAVLGAIVMKLDIRWISHTLASAPPAAVAAAMAILLLQMVLAAKRLSLIIGIFNHVMPFRDAWRVTLEGAFFSNTFVSFLGGDAQRAWQIHKSGLMISEAASAIALDRFIGIVGNHIVVLVCTPYLLLAIPSNAIRVGVLFVSFGGLGAIALVLAFGFFRGRMKSKILRWLQSKRILDLLFEISTVGRYLLVRDTRLVSAMVFSVLIAIINSVAFLIVLLAWHIQPIQAFGCAALIPAVMEIALMPISIAGWGVREGVVIFTFASFAVPAEIAFGSSIIFAFVTLTIGLLGGLIWFFDRRMIKALAPIDGDTDISTEPSLNAAAQ